MSETDSNELSRSGITPYEFEALAQRKLGQHFGVPLKPGTVPNVRKKFDFVSHDCQVVGDAKYFTLVKGQRLPPAKFSVIAEHVWLLEKTNAQHRFLVFGNDRRVPEEWLKRYGNLVTAVAFFFLDGVGEIHYLRK